MIRPQNPPTADQLRADINSWRAGDKVPMLDPAVAPLDTDDEAAGTPPSPEAVAMARAAETRTLHRPAERGLGSTWILIGFIIMLATGILAWGLMQ
jgi:hypothetical protein